MICDWFDLGMHATTVVVLIVVVFLVIVNREITVTDRRRKENEVTIHSMKFEYVKPGEKGDG